MKKITTSICLDYKNDNLDKNEHLDRQNVEKELKDKIRQLEKELQYIKLCLQQSQEEYLVYNEELLSANEEIKIINDELLKINTQYYNKNQELADLYNDMTNYLNSSDIGTVFLDENLCIRKFTPNITKEINLKAQDIGRPIHHISNSLINYDLNRDASEVLKSHMSSEKEVQSKNGNWYLLKYAPYCIAENLLKGVILSLVDITKRKHAEIEIHKSEAENEINKKLLNEAILSETLKTEFFSNLSHELRTPLNVILCTLQLLNTFTSSGEVNDQERKIAKFRNIIKQNCYRQLRLVNNLIDITKLDAGFLELNLQNFNIVSIVESVTLSVAEYIGAQSINLIFDTDIESCIIACDPEKIERVILNLLSNSIKFTKPGGSMTVTMYDKGEHIIISIKDTGIGIPDDKLGIIFDRFRQVDRSLTRKQEGSGIGLSIVKSLVELHSGTISVTSEYGKGTEFVIELPVSVLPEEKRTRNAFTTESQARIEKIHLEFSDIYSLN